MSTWFSEARYGLFIHWGAYAAGERGEWVMNRERIPAKEYRREFVDAFHAEHYDPAEWARLAVRGGMKYVVLTTKHHDGFCLWDTKTTPFNAAKLGPKRDLIVPYVKALRDAGLRVGLYYSVADWTHPDYPGPFERDWPKSWADEAARHRFVAYYQSQIRELLTHFGKVDMLWFDGVIPGPMDGTETVAMIKSLQPEILVNERIGKPFDFRCSEQCLNPKEGPWEACITVGDNWGWHANDEYKSARQVAESLVKVAKQGGNLLLNVGPKADGTIDAAMARPVMEVGDWLCRNPGWLPDSGRSPFSWFNSGHLSVKGSCVYCHLFRPHGGSLCLAEIANRIKSVRLVDGGRRLAFTQRDGRLIIQGLPVPPDPIATVVEIKVEGKPRPLTPQATFWIPQ